MRHLNPLAEANIKDLQNRGINPTLNEIIWINDLARKVDNPDDGKNCMAIGRPVSIGNTWLWPFTIQGSKWYTWILPLLDGESEAEMLSLGFALAFGRERGIFYPLYHYESAVNAIEDWSKGLGATVDELAAAIIELLPASDGLPNENENDDDDDSDSPRKEIQWDNIVAWLVKECGGPPDIWTRQVSRDYVMKQIDVMCQQSRAKGQPPDAHDPVIIATKNLGRGMELITEAHNG